MKTFQMHSKRFAGTNGERLKLQEAVSSYAQHHHHEAVIEEIQKKQSALEALARPVAIAISEVALTGMIDAIYQIVLEAELRNCWSIEVTL
ncbi:MAG TPA: hypothetical protein VNY29_12100 [Terriglobales bacterium]|nr:hypothetical protein [Terriglobales bacterium]